jgi:hypothetical protein
MYLTDVFDTEKIRGDVVVLLGVGMLYYEYLNGRFSQYVPSKNDVYKITIDALNIVGAFETGKVVKITMKLYRKHETKLFVLNGPL